MSQHLLQYNITFPLIFFQVRCSTGVGYGTSSTAIVYINTPPQNKVLDSPAEIAGLAVGLVAAAAIGLAVAGVAAAIYLTKGKGKNKYAL